jgi:hypothetical protein
MPRKRDMRRYFKGLVKEAGPNLNEINRIKRLPMDAKRKQRLIEAYLKTLPREKQKKLLQLQRFLLDESMKRYLG